MTVPEDVGVFVHCDVKYWFRGRGGEMVWQDEAWICHSNALTRSHLQSARPRSLQQQRLTPPCPPGLQSSQVNLQAELLFSIMILLSGPGVCSPRP